MVKAPQFEWDTQEDSRVKYFRSSAPSEDRAIFLHDQVGPCLEDENLSELGQSFNRCTPPTIYEWYTPTTYEWYKRVRQCLDLEGMDLPSLEKLSTGSVDDLLHYTFTWQPAASKSGKKHHLFLDCLEFFHRSFSKEESLELAEEHYIHEDEATDILPSADGQIDRLDEWYELRDRTAIEGFLREDPSLFDLLVTAHSKVQNYFGSGTSIALDVLREPDAKNSGRLFILILTTLPPKEAVNRLDDLDRGWWFDALSTARGKLTVDIDYG